MKSSKRIILAVMAFAALTQAAFSMGSKDSSKPKLKGVQVSKDGQIYPKGTSYITLNLSGENSFTFIATSDPAANGTPVKATSANPSVAQVTQSSSNPSQFTIKALKQGGTYVEVKCDYYKFIFSITVNDTSAAGIAQAKSEQQKKDAELLEIQRRAEANSRASQQSQSATSSSSASQGASQSADQSAGQRAGSQSASSQTSSSQTASSQSSSSQPAGSQSPSNDGWDDIWDFIFGPQGPSVEINKSGMTVETRIGVPEGYERVSVKAGSYEDFYRKLPLKPDGSQVYYYNGKLKSQSFHIAVYDFPQLSEDILQCADACMKMRAEYYYARGEYSKIGFDSEGGVYMPFSKYVDGYRLTGSGWKAGYAKGATREIFDQYLRIVYSYASTRSMAKEMKPISISDLRIGDVFVQSGNPGHAVFVTDMAVNKKTGKKIMLLGQGYMPAQDLHVIKSFESISPWFFVEDKEFSYAEYTFPKGCQGRWPER